MTPRPPLPAAPSPEAEAPVDLWLALRMAIHAGDLNTARAALIRLETPARTPPPAPPLDPDTARHRALMER